MHEVFSDMSNTQRRFQMQSHHQSSTPQHPHCFKLTTIDLPQLMPAGRFQPYRNNNIGMVRNFSEKARLNTWMQMQSIGPEKNPKMNGTQQVEPSCQIDGHQRYCQATQNPPNVLAMSDCSASDISSSSSKKTFWNVTEPPEKNCRVGNLDDSDSFLAGTILVLGSVVFIDYTDFPWFMGYPPIKWFERLGLNDGLLKLRRQILDNTWAWEVGWWLRNI